MRESLIYPAARGQVVQSSFFASRNHPKFESGIERKMNFECLDHFEGSILAAKGVQLTVGSAATIEMIRISGPFYRLEACATAPVEAPRQIKFANSG
jgi:hypothetical protein